MANLVTFSRILLLFIGIGCLYAKTATGAALAVVLIVVTIALDGLDGYIARTTHRATPTGAMFDILADRIVECSLWIVFAHLGVVSVWVPLIVVVRGLVTDAVRSAAFARGKTPFGETTLQTSRLGRAVVASRFSRGLYAVSKAVTFASLAVLLALPLWLGDRPPWLGLAGRLTTGLVYFTVGLCLVRGLPVVWEGWGLVRGEGQQVHAQSRPAQARMREVSGK